MLTHIWGLAFSTGYGGYGDLMISVVAPALTLAVCSYEPSCPSAQTPDLSPEAEGRPFCDDKISILWFKYGLSDNAFHLYRKDWCFKLGRVPHGPDSDAGLRREETGTQKVGQRHRDPWRWRRSLPTVLAVFARQEPASNSPCLTLHFCRLFLYNWLEKMGERGEGNG